MYGIFTNIYPINHPNVGKYTIHGAYGIYKREGTTNKTITGFSQWEIHTGLELSTIDSTDHGDFILALNSYGFFSRSIQWPFQEPKLEVPTIYKAYIRPM